MPKGSLPSGRRRVTWRPAAALLLGAVIAFAASPAGVSFGRPGVGGQGPSFVRFIGRPPQTGLLNSPLGVAVSPTEDQYVYVVDAGNARVEVFTMTSSPVVGHWGRRGSGEGEFWKPSDVAVSPDGTYVYVVDAGLRSVKRFRADALCLVNPTCLPRAKEWGGLGRGPGLFQEPTGLAVDRRGYVYVADRGASEVQVFDAEGSHVRTISGPGNDAGSLLQPTDVAVGPDGRIWVADTMHDRIVWFTPEGAPDGFLTSVGTNKLFNPTGVAVADDGSFIVRDFDPSFLTPRLWRFNSTRQLIDRTPYPLDGTEPNSPKRLQGTAYMANGDVVFANPVGVDYTLYYWRKDKPAPERMAMRGRELTQLDFPRGVALDEQFLAVADAGNKRVLVLNGLQDYQPAMVLAKANLFDFADPAGVAVYRPTAGSPFNEALIYVADPERHSVYVATPRGERRAQWGDGNPGRADTGLAGPEDVAVDGDGNVYIADTLNNRIVRRDPTGAVTAVFGGERLRFPSSVTVGPDGLVYVLERGAHRLTAFSRDGQFLSKWPENEGLTQVSLPMMQDQYVGPGELWAPVGLAADAKYLYVIENDMWRHVRVQVLQPVPGSPLTADGAVVATFVDALGAGAGQVSNPRDIAAARDGRVVVADAGNNRLQLFHWLGSTPTPTATDTPTPLPTATATPRPTDPPTATDAPPMPTDTPSPEPTDRRPPIVRPFHFNYFPALLKHRRL